jgi:hypothetical protein
MRAQQVNPTEKNLKVIELCGGDHTPFIFSEHLPHFFLKPVNLSETIS